MLRHKAITPERLEAIFDRYNAWGPAIDDIQVIYDDDDVFNVLLATFEVSVLRKGLGLPIDTSFSAYEPRTNGPFLGERPIDSEGH